MINAMIPPFMFTIGSRAGPRGATLLSHAMRGRRLVNLELHGLDLLEREDGLQALATHQRDLAVGGDTKWKPDPVTAPRDGARHLLAVLPSRRRCRAKNATRRF